MNKWLPLSGAIASEVTGTLLLKAALDKPILYIFVVLGFAGAFALLAVVLRSGMALGVAYGVWAAAGVFLTATLSAVLYDEPLNLVMAVGLALLIGGVFLVEVGGQRGPRPGDTVSAVREPKS